MNTIKEILTSSRFKSFYWRSGMMFLAGFVSLIADAITGSGLSPQVIMVTGLILGEVSKALNNMVAGKDAGVTA